MNSIFSVLLFLIASTLYASSAYSDGTTGMTSRTIEIVEDSLIYRSKRFSLPDDARRIEYATLYCKGTVKIIANNDTVRVPYDKTTSGEFVVNYDDKTNVVVELFYQSDPLLTLQNACEFDRQDLRYIPPFTYDSANHPRLVALRERYKLDEIAGNGNEISRILNLMHWVHNNVKHDGSMAMLESKDAMSLLEEVKHGRRGLDCRGLATILNECYLSLGYKSRIVSCLPKDTNDREYHVVNTVYSRRWQKWMMVDATHDAYFMDRNGVLMSIGEVRQRLVQGRSIALNPEANWNRTNSTESGNYLNFYLAKNLYRFVCTVHSGFGTEQRGVGKTIEYVRLNPPDYYYQKPDRFESFDGRSGTKFVSYRTNNDCMFWQLP